MVHKMATYILGGGISGLICSFYTGFKVISKDIGGQMNFKTDWHLGPRYLHVDEFSTKLLKDLNIKAKKVNINIGFNMNGDFCENDDIFKDLYYKKTRKLKRTHIKSSASQGRKTFLSYDIDIKLIVKKLLEKTKLNIINTNVKKINLNTKELVLDTGEKLSYNKLISTIPAPIFKQISGAEMPEFKSLKKTFVLTQHPFNLKDFDYVYFAGNEPFHRVTKCPEKPNHFIMEFVDDDIKYNYFKGVEEAEIWLGQIQDTESFTEAFKDVEFLGRYAEWRHNILTNDIIRRSINMGLEEEIKVCAIDIDGVLCEYPKKWVEFANKYFNTNYNLNELKENISFNNYKRAKELYRTSGVKATLPALKGAKEMVEGLQQQGYLVLIMSARPVFEYKEVLRDTLKWFKTNDINPDMHFWGEDKHVKILKYFPEMKFMVEDNAYNANKIAELGYKVYLVDNEYNQQPLNQNVIRIKKLDEVLKNENRS